MRINKGVRPYGGRTFPATLVIYPNGRRAWMVNVSPHEDKGWTGAIKRDEREYQVHEVKETKS